MTRGPGDLARRLVAGVGEDGSGYRYHRPDAGRAFLFTPAKPAIAANPMAARSFRGYAVTRMAVQGSLGTGGAVQPVSGLAWLDHAWGELPLPGGPIAWDRLRLQLDDGTDLAVTRARRRRAGGPQRCRPMLVGPSGAERFDSASLAMEPTRSWRHDGVAYPVAWRLAGGGLELSVAPLVDDQLPDFIAPLWSGMVTAEGSLAGRDVAGTGTLELTGYDRP